MQFRLRYKAHDFELPVGEFVIGRGEDCQLALDDPMVSRRHAVLRVTTRSVSVADLGSRNGVLVNGDKIAAEKRLHQNDRITIGSQEMVLAQLSGSSSPSQLRAVTQTLGAIELSDVQRALGDELVKQAREAHAEETGEIESPGAPDQANPRLASTLRVLSGMAEKALQMGRAEDAERLLSPVLNEILAELQKQKVVDPGVIERAIGYAIKLALGTQRGFWVEFIFEVYAAQEELFPAAVVDDLLKVVRKVKSVNLRIIRAYIAQMKGLSRTFSASERFRLQRIESIEQVSASK